MVLKKQSISLIFILTGLACLLPAAEPADPSLANLPAGCFLNKSMVIPKDQTDAISRKLGIPLVKLSNNFLRIHGQFIQVNILESDTKANAQKLHKVIGKMKNNPAYCLLKGKQVIELCKASLATTIKVGYELGYTPKPEKIHYRVKAFIGAVDKSDYMAANRIFNLFLQYNQNNPKKEITDRISTLIKGFSFGTSVTLRSPRKSDGVLSYTFTPPSAKTVSINADTTTYSFTNLPSAVNVPYVSFTAEISCNSTGLTPSNRKADNTLVSATSYWPANDAHIKALARKITYGRNTRKAKVQALLEWLSPGKNIQFSGAMGSRWGTKKVLKQKFGRCWDFSDCFVTLCRSVKIPCRQVAGWMYGMSGHVWAEFLTEDGTWQQVDPTGGGKLGCGIYHIPYFTTETGAMPILYLSMPQIETIKTQP